MSGYQNKSSFVVAVLSFIIPPLIRSIKTLLFGYPDIFCIYFINKSFSYGQNTNFIFYGPYPFCAYFERYCMLSPKIRAKRVGVIKDKICILKIQDTFVLSRICQKCQGTQIKAFLSFGIKEGDTKRGCSLYSPFNSKHKNTFI